MKLSVPYIGQKGFLESLLERSGKDIEEIYLPLPSRIAGSGRAVYSKGLDYEEIIGLCHENKVKLDLLLNSSCDGLEPYTRKGFDNIMSHLSGFESLGADVVTVANPLFIPPIKESFSMEVKVSVISCVSSAQEAMFYERLGADSINLDRDINRDPKRIKEIRDSVSCRLYLLVNEGCIFKCPFKHFHDNLIGHLSRVPSNGRAGIELNPFADYCMKIREKYPEEILKSPWIRPEDLSRYESLVDGFKISGRDLSKENMLEIVAAYANERYEGNFLSLLNAKSPGMALDNRELECFMNKVVSCDKNCPSCSYCKDFTKEHIKADLLDKR